MHFKVLEFLDSQQKIILFHNYRELLVQISNKTFFKIIVTMFFHNFLIIYLLYVFLNLKNSSGL